MNTLKEYEYIKGKRPKVEIMPEMAKWENSKLNDLNSVLEEFKNLTLDENNKIIQALKKQLK